MKTKELIRARAFVVPNGLYCPDECEFNGGILMESAAYWSQAIFRRWVYKNHDEAWRVARKEKFGLEGLDPKRQKYAEIWFREPTGENKCSNWRDHGIDGFEELEDYELLTSYIPTDIFKGYKEGDTVTFDMPIQKIRACDDEDEDSIQITWIKISLILDQKNSRYPSFGGFHEVLTDKGAWMPCSVPSYRDCRKEIEDLKDKLRNSIPL